MAAGAKSFPIDQKNYFSRLNLFFSLPYYRRKGYIRINWIDASKYSHKFCVPWAGIGTQVRIDGIGPNEGMTFTPNIDHGVYVDGMLEFTFKGNSPVSVDLNTGGGNGSSADANLRGLMPDLASRFLDAFNLTQDESFLIDSQRLSKISVDLDRNKPAQLTADVIDNVMLASHAATLRAARAGRLFSDRVKGAVAWASIFIAVAIAIVLVVPVLQEALGG